MLNKSDFNFLRWTGDLSIAGRQSINGDDAAVKDQWRPSPT